MLDTATELEAVLAGPAADAGLQIADDRSEADLASARGPFTTSMIGDGTGSPRACIAVKDTFSPEDTALAAALASALTGALGGDLQASPSDPVSDAGELAARFAGPANAVGLTDGSELRAIVLVAVERRSGGAASAPSTGSSPSTGGAQSGGARSSGAPSPIPSRFEKLVNVALDVSVELGRTRVTLADVMRYDVGTVVELDRAAGAPVDLRVNGVLLAHGEVVIVDDEYAIRITEVFDHEGDG